MQRSPHILRLIPLVSVLLASLPLWSQAQVQVQDINPVGSVPELMGKSVTPTASTTVTAVNATTQASTATAVSNKPGSVFQSPIDLGESVSNKPDGNAEAQSSEAASGVARRAAQAAQGTAKNTNAKVTPVDRPGVERVQFARLPLRVGLPVGRERLITLPSPAALHVPKDIEAVARIEMIGRTIYITALKPFVAIRMVAELIDGGQQIPLDLVANNQTVAASQELEIFTQDQTVTQSQAHAAGTAQNGSGVVVGGNTAAPAADMVELTRYAARMLYAPRRLAISQSNVQQVHVANQPIVGLIRGGLVESVPMGQWRSAGLYVTAVRVTNKSTQPLEIALEHMRGQWLAATAQHGRLGAMGSDTDTTAIYLICDRAFDACF